jgi:ribosomal protection tetracycline resistance protein
VNLGILAHVDAGKTSLTERLLYAAGVIDEVGSVDQGSTQTDTLALERQRGITIKSAVVSFGIGDVTVNLIDTPGHPDFIAEVERVLAVLDSAVLVVSAVEGVQAQTRVLMRTLHRLGIPTLLFINKIDRRGADHARVLRDIAARLTPAVVAMGGVRDIGTPEAGFAAFDGAETAYTRRLVDLLTERDDALLADYLDADGAVPHERLQAALATQTAAGLVHPVYAGSAMAGAGVDALRAGIAELLPSADPPSEGPPAGTVFKVDRGAAGEKVAYLRMHAGSVHVRDRLRLPTGDDRVTRLAVFDHGVAEPRARVTAGEIAKVWGLAGVRVGDVIGDPAGPSRAANGHHFSPPTLETVIRPLRAADAGALHAALAQLTEQDPLINLRQDDARHELYLSLYGEVQKEVIQATLADDYGIDVAFEQTTTVCVERLAGTGAAAEFIGDEGNPFRAAVGLRVDPAATGDGVRFRLEIELGALPLAFVKAVEESARRTLQQGLHGWQVIDCTVTLTHSGYVPAPPYGWSKWSSSAGDFRKLTPLVLMDALRRARTRVCEPIHRFHAEVPADSLATVLPALARLDAIAHGHRSHGEVLHLDGELPAARVHDLQQRLPALTRGEGVVETTFDRYRPVAGAVPTRTRTDDNPLDREQYLLRVLRVT